MVKSRYIWDGHPTFNDGILIMGPYKPLLIGWVSYPLSYGNVMGVDRPDRTYICIKFDAHKIGNLMTLVGLYTLPETNIAPKNGWLEYYFPIGEAYFQGLC